jgi:hypothetical protein
MRWVFGILDCGVALLVAICVFRFLPTRWWVVDGGAVVTSAALAASGVALLAKSKQAERIVRIGSWITLALGAALVLALVATAGWLSGVYGPLGRGGAALFGLVSALALPYVVVLPMAQLLWVGPREKKQKET